MNRKLVINSVGFFGLGALVGWAITGDLHDRKARLNRAAFRKIISNQANLIYDLQQASGIDVAELLDRQAGITDETASTHLIEDARLHSVSLDPEPNAFGESIKVDIPIEDVEGNDRDVIDEEPAFPEGETEEETRTNLQNLIDKYTGDPDTVDEFVNAARPTIKSDHTPPYVISQEEYAWGEDGMEYEKVTLTYYPNDRVLLDDDEDVVIDINLVVGWRNLSRFGDESKDPDTVFIRNDKLMSDYEVVREVENPLPLHVGFAMSKDEFKLNKAAGLIKMREGDQ